MSQENVEIVRAMLATFIEVDEGLVDRGRLNKFLPADVVFDLGTYAGWTGQSNFRGTDEFIDFRAAWMEPYEDWSWDVETILDAGANLVVAVFHQRGRPSASEGWLEMRYGIVYTVEQDLIRRAEVYATVEEALEAAGLPE